MSSFVVEGGHKLSGDIRPQGAKNEALQIISAVLLTDEDPVHGHDAGVSKLSHQIVDGVGQLPALLLHLLHLADDLVQKIVHLLQVVA